MNTGYHITSNKILRNKIQIDVFDKLAKLRKIELERLQLTINDYKYRMDLLEKINKEEEKQLSVYDKEREADINMLYLELARPNNIGTKNAKEFDKISDQIVALTNNIRQLNHIIPRTGIIENYTMKKTTSKCKD